MKQVKDLQIGDEVVISPEREGYLYRFGKVEKITATQVTVSGTRYNKRDGVRIGDGDAIWGRNQRIVFDYITGLMSVEEAKKLNVNLEYNLAVSTLSKRILNTPLSTLKNLPLETLQEVVKLLGLES